MTKAAKATDSQTGDFTSAYAQREGAPNRAGTTRQMRVFSHDIGSL
jgi:hypothetical protein